MLDPLPYREPDRLVSVWLTRNGSRNYPAAADAIDLRQLPGVFQDVALLDNINLNLVGDGEPERLQAAAVSATLFSLLGTSGALGRAFEPGEDQAGPSGPGYRQSANAFAIHRGKAAARSKWGVVRYIGASGLEMDPLPQVYWTYRQ